MATATIRLSLNEELRSVLDDIKQSYPLLEYPEIMRMALSSYYQKFQEQRRREWEKNLPVRKATAEEEKCISKGVDDITNDRFTTIQAGDPKALKKFLRPKK